MFTKSHILYSPNLEITEVFINLRDFFSQCSNIIQQNITDICNNKDKSKKMKAKKLERKYFLYYSIYVKLKNGQN